MEAGKNMKQVRAYDKKNKKWYTFIGQHVPSNILELIKLEGLILEKDFYKNSKTKKK